MRFFTKEWFRGELPDADFEAVPVAYSEHLTALKLPADVSVLAVTDIHDGHLLGIRYDPRVAELTLWLRCGDLQRGYRDLSIRYSGVTLDASSNAVLHKALRIPKDEFLYDEVDRRDDRFEHRIILASQSEACVTFTGVAVESHLVDSRAAN